MTVQANIFTDTSLTTPFDDAIHSLSLSAVQGDTAYGSFAVGTTTEGNEVGAQSAMGVDPISVLIIDNDPGNGVEGGHIKLALSVAGLASATPGAPLDIGTLIPYGSPVEVFYQWGNSVGSGQDTGLVLRVTDRGERAM
jgi:hypothetical protein